MQHTKMSPKVAIWAPSHNFVGLYFAPKARIDNRKKLVKQRYVLHMSPQYGELRRPTNSWDPSGSLRHPCKFQQVSRLGSVTARHSSIGRQPNFAALNRGRHLYSAGRPSRWVLAHILVLSLSCTIFCIMSLHAHLFGDGAAISHRPCVGSVRAARTVQVGLPISSAARRPHYSVRLRRVGNCCSSSNAGSSITSSNYVDCRRAFGDCEWLPVCATSYKCLNC